ncbi:MAG TPA: hypothetical protein VJL86_07755 [Steroidobacteraceae bacterium]|nr:hypothetical protein [Steroidobacteraceae bacterium]
MKAFRVQRCLAVLLAGLLSACSDSDSGGDPPSPEPMVLTRVMGGQLADLVVSGQFAYVATGRVIATWDFSDTRAPTQVGAVAQPAGGLITGLALHGDHLYASWRTGDDTSGVAIYSLADPAQPAFVSEALMDADFSHAGAIAAANGHLFVFDSENGIWVSSLAEPEALGFSTDGTGLGGAFDRTFVDGNLIHVFGRSFIGSAVLTTYDVTTPGTPQELQTFFGDGIDIFDLRFDAPFAVGFGAKLSVLDLSNPDVVVPRGSADTLAMTGIVNATNAYGLGFEGLDVWDIADPDNPAQVDSLDIETFGAAATATVDGGALMLTTTDRFVFLDTSTPLAPAVAGSALMSGSVDAYDAATVGDSVLFLQQNYGLAVADAATLQVLARYEFDLPATPQDRVFNDMHVDGNLAYLAAWGFGLIVADVSDPAAPAEVARLPAAFAHTVAVADARAYVARNTNGPEFGVVDVSDPANPGFLASYALSFTPAQLAARDGNLYVAGYPNGDLSSVGLRIIDVSDAANAIELGFYDEDCPAAFEVKLVEELAYLACSNGLHIVDVSDPVAPVRVGYAAADDLLDVHTSLEVRGDRAWFGSPAGILELDVTDPTNPVSLAVTETGFYGPINLRAIGDNRVIGMFGITGVHVFEGAASD